MPGSMSQMRRETKRTGIKKGPALRQDLIFQAAGIGLAILDIEGRWQRINRTLLTTLGYEEEELLGRSSIELSHPDDVIATKTVLESLRRGTSEHVHLEKRYIAKDGAIVWADVNITSIRDDMGRLTGFLGTGSNITDQKLAEMALLHSEAQKEAILEGLPDVVVQYLSPHMQVIWTNKMLLERRGLNLEQMKGRFCYDMNGDGAGPCMGCPASVTMKTGLANENEVTKESGRSWIIRSSPVKDELGDMAGIIVLAVNVTERKKAEEALRAERDFAQKLLDTAQVIIIVLDTDARVRHINRYMEELSGYSLDEVIGKDWFTVFVPDSIRADLQALFKEAINQRKTLGNTSKIVTKDGRHPLIEWYDQVLKDSQGVVTGLLAIGHDVTKRIRMEQALRKKEEWYRTLYERAPLGYQLLNEDGRFIHINQTWLDILGYSREEVVGRHFSEFLVKEQRENFNGHFERVREQGEAHDVRFQMVRKDGTRCDASFEVRVLYDAQGRFRHTQCMLADITERKRMEEQLRSSREILRSLAEHLISIREDERTRIARELHDELGQSLSALHLDLQWVKKRLRKDQRLLTERVDALTEVANDAIETVKRIQGDLRPSLLDNLGLIAALEWQTKKFTAYSGIKVDLSYDGSFRLTDRVSTAIFRIVQEALTNIHKHAGATTAQVELIDNGVAIRLTITDNGCGMRREDLKKAGSFGLIGMRERLSSINGTLEISGSEGTGVTLDVRIPNC